MEKKEGERGKHFDVGQEREDWCDQVVEAIRCTKSKVTRRKCLVLLYLLKYSIHIHKTILLDFESPWCRLMLIIFSYIILYLGEIERQGWGKESGLHCF